MYLLILQLACRKRQEFTLLLLFLLLLSPLFNDDGNCKGRRLHLFPHVTRLSLNRVCHWLCCKWRTRRGRLLCWWEGPSGPLRMALTLVRSDIVLLLKLLATKVAGELVERVGVMLFHVPVQGRFLAAGETTDLTPG